jgi:hypothetical protein
MIELLKQHLLGRERSTEVDVLREMNTSSNRYTPDVTRQLIMRTRERLISLRKF